MSMSLRGNSVSIAIVYPSIHWPGGVLASEPQRAVASLADLQLAI